jgi:tetratricopeptide (TPR) repeat protein
MALSRTYRQRRTNRYWLSAAPFCMAGSLFVFIQVTPLLYQTWKGQQLANFTEEELLAKSGQEIKALADNGYQIDPGASQTQTRFANALRVQAGEISARLRGQNSRSLSEYRKAGQLAHHALAIYDRVYEANPLDDSLLIKKAMTYDAIGRYAEASLFYRKALELRPHSGNFHFAVAHHYLRQGQLEEARDSFRIATRQGVQANPNIAEQIGKAREMIRQINRILQKQKDASG